MAKSKAKTPKTIAGMKVPKVLRKSRWLDPLPADPQTREIVADVLIAAAGAAAAALVKERPSLRPYPAKRQTQFRGFRSPSTVGISSETVG